MLVGNGGGGVSHEDFAQHVHDVLTEFGPKPEDGPWQEFAEQLGVREGDRSAWRTQARDRRRRRRCLPPICRRPERA
jgi:hypothetical protein